MKYNNKTTEKTISKERYLAILPEWIKLSVKFYYPFKRKCTGKQILEPMCKFK